MMEYPKLEIWFTTVRIKGKLVHRCGVGECIVDGTYAEGRTKSIAALNFIKKYNADNYLKIMIG